ncbi:hypothetical protein GS492_09735 [Rhodococcus hoagii]|nr:hypothetical protein [Prescottella equi]
MSDDLEVKNGGPATKLKTVFVVSPIGTPGTEAAVNASLALEYIIREALPLPEWKVVRADEETDPGSITNKVIERIVSSDLIVADLTGHNPNVFYELAVAHGYKKPVVTIMTEGEKVPFDIVDMRTVFYDLTNPASVHTAKAKLCASARAVLDNPNPTNPLVAHAMFSTASNSADATPADKLEFAMGQILGRLTHIESRIDGINASRHGGSPPLPSKYARPVSSISISSDDFAKRRREVEFQLESVVRELRKFGELGATEEMTPEQRERLVMLEEDFELKRRQADKLGIHYAMPE